MKKILILVIAFLLFACKSEDNMPIDDYIFEFSLVSAENKDLLDKDTENTYNTDKIKIYRIVDEKPVLYNKPHLDYPNGYVIRKHQESDDLHVLRLFLTFSSNYEERIIEWDSNKKDTISMELINSSEKSFKLIKIKYNGNLVWNEDTGERKRGFRYFKITK